jgi:dephospho-CoA kinase
MSNERIVFVGPSAAGKDTVADRMALLTGAEVISTSTQVRKTAKEAGLINPTRGELQEHANRMRKTYGDDIFAKLTAEEIANKKGKRIIINGVRNPKEINVFGDALVMGVDASREKRFERTLKRKRSSDPKNWEEFLACDVRENGTMDGIGGQQNYQCLSRADLIIYNEGNSLEGLEYAVDLLIDRWITTGKIRQVGSIKPNDLESDKKKPIVVANGPHGTGKTTVSRVVSQDTGSRYLEEIGGQLRKEVDYNAIESTVDFDREVMRRELLRDHQLLRAPNSETYIVETWHTGNIAYALKRSPSLAASYIEEFKKQLQKFSVFHILLTINDSTFLHRATEKVVEAKTNELLCFYRDITAHTRKLYSMLNLDYKEVENDGDLNMTRNNVRNLVQQYAR